VQATYCASVATDMNYSVVDSNVTLYVQYLANSTPIEEVVVLTVVHLLRRARGALHLVQSGVTSWAAIVILLLLILCCVCAICVRIVRLTEMSKDPPGRPEEMTLIMPTMAKKYGGAREYTIVRGS
jgi:hypothetical protein